LRAAEPNTSNRRTCRLRQSSASSARFFSNARSEVARLALMADGENKHEVVLHVEFVKRDVTRVAARDNQLPVTPFDGPSDQGMLPQHPEAIDQQRRGVARRDGIGFQQEIRESVEILERGGRQDEPGQYRFTGFGRLGFLPATLAWM